VKEGRVAVEITVAHMNIAAANARKFCRRLPPGADADAFYGVAMEALAVAAMKYDGHGDYFVKFAVGRIWFAMIDEARRQGPLSRGAIRKLRAGIPVTPVYFESLNQPVHEHDGGSAERIDLLADPADEYGDADARLDRQEAMRRLSERQRVVLTGRACGLTQEELAATLGVTAARISQIQHKAWKRVAA
jgi:RNA polymerase sigma factor (sigma-70 family)